MLEIRAAVALGRLRLDVALEVPRQTFVLVGPSGAGKSTVLNLAAGLVRPDSGRIRLGERMLFDGRQGIDLAPERRRLGLMFQEYALFPHLSVLQNVAYGPKARGERDGEKNARQWLERLGLEACAGTRIRDLSGGQRQRVALARALASGAEALLLDEPFSSLDVAGRRTLRGELRAFLQQAGLPTLLVTHDPLDALALGDSLGVLENGRLAQVGPRDELLARPRTPFIAELLGLNLFPATLEAGHGLRAAAHPPLVFRVLAEGLEGAVFLVFAPSEVALARERPAGSAQNVFTCRVTAILPLSDRLRVMLDAGVPLMADVTLEAAESLRLVAGAPVWASVKATSIQVYA